MPSAKQIAWRKKFARMSKAGKFKKFAMKKAISRTSPTPRSGQKFYKELGNITIDKRSEASIYITIGNWEVYLDDSTGERIIDQRSV